MSLVLDNGAALAPVERGITSGRGALGSREIGGGRGTAGCDARALVARQNRLAHRSAKIYADLLPHILARASEAIPSSN